MSRVGRETGPLEEFCRHWRKLSAPHRPENSFRHFPTTTARHFCEFLPLPCLRRWHQASVRPRAQDLLECGLLPHTAAQA